MPHGIPTSAHCIWRLRLLCCSCRARFSAGAAQQPKPTSQAQQPACSVRPAGKAYLTQQLCRYLKYWTTVGWPAATCHCRRLAAVVHALQLTASEMQIRSYVFDVVRATVPNIILDDVFTVSGTGWWPALRLSFTGLLAASAPQPADCTHVCCSCRRLEGQQQRVARVSSSAEAGSLWLTHDHHLPAPDSHSAERLACWVPACLQTGNRQGGAGRAQQGLCCLTRINRCGNADSLPCCAPACLPCLPAPACLQTKEEIAKEVQDELSKAFATFGYEILQALVTDIDPDPRVKAAMNEVSCLQRTRHAA